LDYTSKYFLPIYFLPAEIRGYALGTITSANKRADPNQNTALVQDTTVKMPAASTDIHGSFDVFRNTNCRKQRSRQKLGGAQGQKNYL